LIIYVVTGTLYKLFGKKTIIILSTVTVVRLFLDMNQVLSKEFLISFGIMLSLYIVFFGFVRKLSENYFDEISVHKLEEGHKLAEGVLATGFKAPTKMKAEYVVDKHGPLEKEDVKHIKGLHGGGKLHFNKIKVHQTIPFAPFMFMGVLVTIICEGNLLMFLRVVIGL
ncbi:hypothetical protein ACFL0V_07210, partial [Nanoarchaeota archaeon]